MHIKQIFKGRYGFGLADCLSAMIIFDQNLKSDIVRQLTVSTDVWCLFARSVDHPEIAAQHALRGVRHVRDHAGISVVLWQDDDAAHHCLWCWRQSRFIHHRYSCGNLLS